MRVVVVAEALGQLRASEVAQAVGRAWFLAGAEVAVTPTAKFFPPQDFIAGLADLWGVEISQFQGQPVVLSRGKATAKGKAALDLTACATSAIAGEYLRTFCQNFKPLDEIVLLASPPDTPDGGATFFQSLTGAKMASAASGLAAQALAEAKLTLVVPSDERSQKALGLDGVVGEWAFVTKQDVATRLKVQQKLEALDTANRGNLPGSGAVGSLGLAILTLGGTVKSAPETIGDWLNLDVTVAKSDLVVGVINEILVDHEGGEVAQYLSGLAAVNQKPLIAVSNSSVPTKDARALGIEQVYNLGERIERLLVEQISSDKSSRSGKDTQGDIQLNEEMLTKALRSVAITWVR